MSTGRLYRAVGATGPQAEGALPALDETRQRPRLRTAPADQDLSISGAAKTAPEGPRVHRDDGAHVEPIIEGAPSEPFDAGPSPDTSATAIDEHHRQPPVLTPDYAHLFGQVEPTPTPPSPSAETQAVGDEPVGPDGGLRWNHVSFILITVALVLGAASVRFTGEFGLSAGGPFFLVVVLTALFTRFQDRWAPAVMAPIAWLAAVLGPGQFTISHTKSPLLDQALLIFQGLSDNALWVLGSVMAGAGVAVARNRRGS
jgi:hypothetical protein